MFRPKQAWYDTDRSVEVKAPSRKSSISISSIVDRAEMGKE